MKGQEFVEVVKKMAKENGLNIFVAVDNASGWSNSGNKVIKSVIEFFKTINV